MAVIVAWDDESGTVIRLDFETPWTWAEQQQAIEQATQIVESVSWTVDIICDLSGGPQFPLGYPMKYLRLTAERVPKNAGITIIVGASAPVQSLLLATMQVYANLRYRTFFVQSLEAAHAMLSERRNNQKGQSR